MFSRLRHARRTSVLFSFQTVVVVAILALGLAPATTAQELVDDIWPGADGSLPLGYAVFEEQLYFRANDGTHGTELWRFQAANCDFSVTTTDDSGAGSLRQAILDANASAGAETICFDIPGEGPHTIQPQSAFPEITDAITIDGLTQSGASCTNWPATLMIEIDGTSAGFTSLLRFSGGSSIVRGLVLNRYNGGIALTGSGGNTVTCNYIGTDADGAQDLTTGSYGVFINGSPNNTIGGTTASDRNLISGNSLAGVQIQGASATGNTVQNNYVGTNAGGTATLLNDNRGITINTDNNIVAENLLSGNGKDEFDAALLLAGSSNTVWGNCIGTAVDCTSPLGNGGMGIHITKGPNTVGGPAAGEGNVVAYNAESGIVLDDQRSSVTGVSLRGNAVFANGDLGIDLGDDGVTINDPNDTDDGPNGLQNFPALDNLPVTTGGGATTSVSGTLQSAPSTTFQIEFFASEACDGTRFGEGERFLEAISETTNGSGAAVFNESINTDGVPAGWFITATATDPDGNTSEFSQCDVFPPDALVVKNTNDDGDNSLRSAIQAANNQPNDGGPDVITFDIPASDPGCDGNGVCTIQPLSALPPINDVATIDALTQPGADCSAWPPALKVVLNGSQVGQINGNGLQLTAPSTVRGLVINDFAFAGVRLAGTGGHSLQCNFIGTDVSGTLAVPNFDGISVQDVPNNIIGGAGPSTRNLISGNEEDGIEIRGTASTGTVIQGNYIGTDVTGASGLGNGRLGIWNRTQASGTIIGGASPGAGNLVSGNSSYGIYLTDSDDNTIQGNLVGTDADGMSDLGNALGIFILGGSGNTVGGLTDAERNVVSGNTLTGVEIQKSFSGIPTTGNVVQGNYIGTDITGNAPLPNDEDGVLIEDASDNTIGGSTDAARNVISGNGDDGVDVFGAETTGNLIQGNYIGLGADGTTAVPNVDDGIDLEDSASNTLRENVISSNVEDGITLSNSTNNVIQGNRIGTDAGGTQDRGNGTDGIRLDDGSSDNTIGGAADSGNIIAFNGGIGVAVFSGTGNRIELNSIFTNGGLGIAFGTVGITPNDAGDGDDGANNLQNFPTISSTSYDAGANQITLTYQVDSTPANSAYPIRVEFFRADAEGEEGQTFLGSDTYAEADFTGDPDKEIMFTPEAPVTSSDQIVATATDADGNTSEFTGTSVPLPVELTSFEATLDGEAVRLEWQTASETGNAGFEIERKSEEAETWAKVAFVEGRGTTSEPQRYRFTDADLPFDARALTYRLKQVDVDGTFEYSPEVEVAMALPERFALEPNYPNPFGSQTTIRYAVPQAGPVRLAVYDVLGREVVVLVDEQRPAGRHEVVFDAAHLPSGLYLMRLTGPGSAQTRRMTVVK